MAETVGEAYVKIVTDSKGLNNDVRRILEQQGAAMDKAGKQNARRFNDAFRDEISSNDGIGASILDELEKQEGRIGGMGKLLGDDFRRNLEDSLGKKFDDQGFAQRMSQVLGDDIEEAARRGQLAMDDLGGTLRNKLLNAEKAVNAETDRFNQKMSRLQASAIAANKAFDSRKEKEFADELDRATKAMDRMQAAAIAENKAFDIRKAKDQEGALASLRGEAEKLNNSLFKLENDWFGFTDSLKKGATDVDDQRNRLNEFRRTLTDLDGGLRNITERSATFGHDLDRNRVSQDVLDSFDGLRHVLGNVGDGLDDTERRITRFRTVTRRPISFGGLLGEFQKFGNLLRTGAIDITNWRQGLLAATDTVLGFGKSIYKSALLLGPLAAGISSLAGIVTAFAGSIQTGLIGGLAALGPVALAAGASMAVLALGMKAFGKNAKGPAADAVKGIKKQFTDLQTSVQMTLFSDVAAQGKALVPVLATVKTGLIGVADAMRDTVSQMLRMLSTGMTGDQFRDLTKALGPLSRQLGTTLVNSLSGFISLMHAALPVSERFATSLVTLTTRFATWAASGKGQSTLVQYFDRAYDSASKLMRILGQLGSALFHVLDIGDKTTGKDQLDAMLDSVTRFNNYVKSAKGVTDLERWFTRAGDAGHKLAGAVKAVGVAFGALDTDQTARQFDLIIGYVTRLITGFAKMVTETQKITSPFSPLGQSASDAWEAVKQLASTISDIYKTVTETGSTTVLSTAFNLLAAAATGVNAILKVMAPILTAIATAFSALPGPIQSTVAALLIMQRLGIIAWMKQLGTAAAVAGGSAGIGGLATGAAALGGAKVAGIWTRIATGAKSIGKAFGPVGLAIGAVALGLGLLSSHQKAAAAAAKEHRDEVEKLTTAMENSKSATGIAVTGTTALLLAQKNLLQNSKDLGVSQTELVSAALGNAEALGKVHKAGDDAVQTQKDYNVAITRGAQAVGALTPQQNEASKASADHAKKVLQEIDAFNKIVSSVEDANKAWHDAQTANAALNQATSAVNPTIQALTANMHTFADTTQTAATRTDALVAALDTLTTPIQSTQEAAIHTAEGFRSLTDAFSKTSGLNIKSVFAGNTTAFQANTKAASALDQTMTSVQHNFAETVRAAFDAKGGMGNLAEATDAATTAAKNYSDKLITQLTNMGLTRKQAQKIVTDYGLIPKNINTLLKLDGAKVTEQQMKAVLDLIPKAETPINMALDVTDVVTSTKEANALIAGVKQGKIPAISADPTATKIATRIAQAYINATKQYHIPSLTADNIPLKTKTAAAQTFINEVAQKVIPLIDVNTKDGMDKLKALSDKLTELDGMAVQTYVDTIVRTHPEALPKNAGAIRAALNNKTGSVVDRPTLTWVGEGNRREAIVPMDLPLRQVNPDVRGIAALLRGSPGTKSSTNGVASQKVQNNTIHVHPQAADPHAVSTSLLNRLVVLGR